MEAQVEQGLRRLARTRLFAIVTGGFNMTCVDESGEISSNIQLYRYRWCDRSSERIQSLLSLKTAMKDHSCRCFGLPWASKTDMVGFIVVMDIPLIRFGCWLMSNGGFQIRVFLAATFFNMTGPYWCTAFNRSQRKGSLNLLKIRFSKGGSYMLYFAACWCVPASVVIRLRNDEGNLAHSGVIQTKNHTFQPGTIAPRLWFSVVDQALIKHTKNAAASGTWEARYGGLGLAEAVVDWALDD